jgi:hypothetical protein
MGMGGLTLSSLVRSAWETIICAALSVGLIVLFREVFPRPNRLLLGMVAISFAAYILHLPIVIAPQAAIERLALPAIAKFALGSAARNYSGFWNCAPVQQCARPQDHPGHHRHRHAELGSRLT